MHNTQHYTHEVGRKFEADGSARMFPGNTVLCFVEPQSPIGRAATAFGTEIGQQPWGAKWAMLPPSSFHMTVMDLLCDQVRSPKRWSSQLVLDADLRDTDVFFGARVPALPVPQQLVMRVDAIDSRDGILVMLEPAEAATDKALREHREALAQATGVRAPDHDTYRFHISIAYRLIVLDEAEEASLAALCGAWEGRLRAAGGRIELGAPELCFFDDMTRFVPLAERHELRSRGG